MNIADIARLGLRDGGQAMVETVADDGVTRRLGGLRVTAYDIPQGNCAGYYPEMNVLIPSGTTTPRPRRPPRNPSRSASSRRDMRSDAGASAHWRDASGFGMDGP